MICLLIFVLKYCYGIIRKNKFQEKFGFCIFIFYSFQVFKLHVLKCFYEQNKNKIYTWCEIRQNVQIITKNAKYLWSNTKNMFCMITLFCEGEWTSGWCTSCALRMEIWQQSWDKNLTLRKSWTNWINSATRTRPTRLNWDQFFRFFSGFFPFFSTFFQFSCWKLIVLFIFGANLCYCEED